MKVSEITKHSLRFAFAASAVSAAAASSDISGYANIVAGVFGLVGVVSLVTANVKPHDTWKLGSLIKSHI